VKLGIAGRGARLAQASAMAAFMIESIVYFGIGSFLGALPVVGLSLPVIVNRRAARRPEARSAIRLVELGRGNAIKRLKTDLDALRDQLRATEQDLAVNTTAAREAERALAHKESELARLTSALDERSMQENVQKTEIVTLRMQVETLHGQLAQVGETAKALEERRNVAVSALSEKESELARLATALDERSVLANWQKAEIAALTMQVQALNGLLTQAGEETKAVEGRRDAALQALSEKESELARLATALDERSMLTDWQEGQIAAQTTQIQALNERLTQASEEIRAVEERYSAAVRALSEKESELARVTNALDEGSAVVDSQKGEIASLTIQVRTLKEELSQARERTTAAEDRRDATLRAKESELAMLTNVLEEHSVLIESQKVENAALRMQGRMLNERLIQAGKEARALEERCDVELAEQSRLLNESESELAHLRGEIEIARGAEDDLRVAIIEIDGRANAAIQNLTAEKSQLQAALDRANGERARFVHELAGMKRRQADESRPAERLDNATCASTTSLPKGPGVRPIADYHEERSAAAPASSPCRRIAPC
jgi:chromosome segregation ATPase